MRYPDQREYLFGTSAEQIAAVCRVNRTTAARWKSGASRMPFAAFVVLELAIGGMMPPAIAGGAWQGWRFGADGRLYAPDVKRGYEPHHIRQLDILLPLFTWSSELRELVRSHLDQAAGAGVLARDPDHRSERDRQVNPIVAHGGR